MSASTTVPTTLALALDLETIERLAEAVAERVAPAQPSDDRWLDSREAAGYLALPLSTIRKLTASESIPFSQDVPGGRCYFLRSELDQWRLGSAHGPRN